MGRKKTIWDKLEVLSAQLPELASAEANRLAEIALHYGIMEAAETLYEWNNDKHIREWRKQS